VELDYSSLKSINQEFKILISQNQLPVKSENVEIIGQNLYLKGEVLEVIEGINNNKLNIVFDTTNIERYRQLITKIYCLDNNPWTSLNTASEWKTIYLLFRSLITTPWRWINYNIYQRKMLLCNISYELEGSEEKKTKTVLTSTWDD